MENIKDQELSVGTFVCTVAELPLTPKGGERVWIIVNSCFMKLHCAGINLNRKLKNKETMYVQTFRKSRQNSDIQ